MFSIRDISLWDRFKILKFCNAPTPSILDILLLCKSNTYNFVSSLIPRILLIWFLGSNNTLSVGSAKFSISFIRLSYRSIYRRFGSDIRFSILLILLCWKVIILSFYSPYSKGTCVKSNESRLSFSRFASL